MNEVEVKVILIKWKVFVARLAELEGKSGMQEREREEEDIY